MKFGRKAEAQAAREKGLKKAVGSHANLMQMKQLPVTHSIKAGRDEFLPGN